MLSFHVKFVQTDRQTDNSKTKCPQSFIKRLLFFIFINQLLNSLPNDKILDWSKFKASVDDKIDATEKNEFFLRRFENIVGKGENATYQHFLHFP